MIKVNDRIVELDRFPDGTLHLVPPYNYNRVETRITWFFEKDEEMIAILYLARHYQNHGVTNLKLIMPYIPNARQDRVKNPQNVFTLKYFAEIINSIGFSSVVVLDPHSAVSEALINNIVALDPQEYIHSALKRLDDNSIKDSLIAFYPDEGAMKRYSGLNYLPYAFGIKKRDWETGKIQGLDVAGRTDLVEGSDILIIDDICSRGGTFYYSAKKLKELGANRIFLYITHCEPTILEGDIFKSGLIDKVFTTNSIFREKDMERAQEIGVADKIEVFKYAED